MILKLLKAIFGKKPQLPEWAHGLECDICQTTWTSAQAHYDDVIYDANAYEKHKGKIPRLHK